MTCFDLHYCNEIFLSVSVNILSKLHILYTMGAQPVARKQFITGKKMQFLSISRREKINFINLPPENKILSDT